MGVTKSERERLNALRRARYRKNPAQFREWAYRWIRKKPDKVRAWRNKNRKRINASARVRYWRNVGASRAKGRAHARKWIRTWTPVKRKQVAAKKAEWYYANLERERAAARARYRRRRLKRSRVNAGPLGSKTTQ